MPFAVTHVILTIILVGLFRDFFMRKKFPVSFIAFAGLAGLLPDADLAFVWMLNLLPGTSIDIVTSHRVYTHSLIWVALFATTALLIHFFIKKKHYKLFGCKVKKSSIVAVFAILAASWFIHMLLDCTLASYEHLTLVPGIPLSFCPRPFSDLSLLTFDAIILLSWLFWEQHKHKIRDYV